MLALVLAARFGAPVEPTAKSLDPSACDCTWALGGCSGTGDGSVCWPHCCSKPTMHAWRDAVSKAWPGTDQDQHPAVSKASPAAASLSKVVQDKRWDIRAQHSPFVHYLMGKHNYTDAGRRLHSPAGYDPKQDDAHVRQARSFSANMVLAADVGARVSSRVSSRRQRSPTAAALAATAPLSCGPLVSLQSAPAKASMVVHNNLGGMGPKLDDPHAIRIANVAWVELELQTAELTAAFRPLVPEAAVGSVVSFGVDLELSNRSRYEPLASSINGVRGGALSVNMIAGTSSVLHVALKPSCCVDRECTRYRCGDGVCDSRGERPAKYACRVGALEDLSNVVPGLEFLAKIYDADQTTVGVQQEFTIAGYRGREDSAAGALVNQGSVVQPHSVKMSEDEVQLPEGFSSGSALYRGTFRADAVGLKSKPRDAMEFALPFMRGYYDMKMGFPSERKHSYGRTSRFWTEARSACAPTSARVASRAGTAHSTTKPVVLMADRAQQQSEPARAVTMQQEQGGECYDSCENPPKTCTEFLAMTESPGCASSCPNDLLTEFMVTMPDAPCASWESEYARWVAVNGKPEEPQRLESVPVDPFIGGDAPIAPSPGPSPQEDEEPCEEDAPVPGTLAEEAAQKQKLADDAAAAAAAEAAEAAACQKKLKEAQDKAAAAKAAADEAKAKADEEASAASKAARDKAKKDAEDTLKRIAEEDQAAADAAAAEKATDSSKALADKAAADKAAADASAALAKATADAKAASDAIKRDEAFQDAANKAAEVAAAKAKADADKAAADKAAEDEVAQQKAAADKAAADKAAANKAADDAKALADKAAADAAKALADAGLADKTAADAKAVADAKAAAKAKAEADKAAADAAKAAADAAGDTVCDEASTKAYAAAISAGQSVEAARAAADAACTAARNGASSEAAAAAGRAAAQAIVDGKTPEEAAAAGAAAAKAYEAAIAAGLSPEAAAAAAEAAGRAVRNGATSEAAAAAAAAAGKAYDAAIAAGLSPEAAAAAAVAAGHAAANGATSAEAAAAGAAAGKAYQDAVDQGLPCPTKKEYAPTTDGQLEAVQDLLKASSATELGLTADQKAKLGALTEQMANSEAFEPCETCGKMHAKGHAHMVKAK